MTGLCGEGVSMKQMMHVLVVFVLAVLLQACAGNANVVKAFEGERAAAELARIKMPAAFALRRIDDRGFGIFSRPPGDEHGFYEIQLPPGSHLITLFYSQYWEVIVWNPRTMPCGRS
jgi:hypothetical protein